MDLILGIFAALFAAATAAEEQYANVNSGSYPVPVTYIPFVPGYNYYYGYPYYGLGGFPAVVSSQVSGGAAGASSTPLSAGLPAVPQGSGRVRRAVPNLQYGQGYGQPYYGYEYTFEYPSVPSVGSQKESQIEGINAISNVNNGKEKRTVQAYQYVYGYPYYTYQTGYGYPYGITGYNGAQPSTVEPSGSVGVKVKGAGQGHNIEDVRTS